MIACHRQKYAHIIALLSAALNLFHLTSCYLCLWVSVRLGRIFKTGSRDFPFYSISFGIMLQDFENIRIFFYHILAF